MSPELPGNWSGFLIPHLKAPDPAPRGLQPPSGTAGQPASTSPAAIPQDNPGRALKASAMAPEVERDIELSEEAAEQLLSA